MKVIDNHDPDHKGGIKVEGIVDWVYPLSCGCDCGSTGCCEYAIPSVGSDVELMDIKGVWYYFAGI